MSLFTEILNSAVGGLAPEQAETKTQNLLNGALGMLESMGGVDGLMQKFQQSGLGDLASSWVGTGDNKSIQPNQLAQVLGKDQIAALTKQAGIPEEQGATVLSQILPAMVDKLTPDGKAPATSSLGTLGKVLLGGVGAAVAATAAASYFGSKKDEEELPAAGSTPATPSPAASDIAAAQATSAAARSYTVVGGDTLSKISKQFYGDANQWRRIFDANRNILNNPDRISPGQKLRIP
jgi:uncharacterized protein YidB (DUF937 family)